MDTKSRCAELLVRQKLLRKSYPVNVLELLEHIGGIQSQIFTHSLLAIQCRTEQVDPNEIKASIEKEKKIIRTWSLRGTLHLMSTADAALMWSAFSHEWFTRWGSYLNKHVTEYQKELVSDAILTCLSDGPQTRESLKAKLKKAIHIEHDLIDYLLSPWGGILKDLSYKRLVIHGQSNHNEIKFCLTSSWLKDQQDVFKTYDQEEALGILLLRYLKAYGPSKIEDFAYWSGITITLAKKIFNQMKAELIAINDLFDNKNMCTANNYEHIPAVKLLPKFDPLLLGHKQKFYLKEEHYKKIFSGAGHINAAVLVNGYILGTWRWKGKKISLDMFTQLDEGFQVELEQEVKKIELFYLAHE